MGGEIPVGYLNAFQPSTEHIWRRGHHFPGVRANIKTLVDEIDCPALRQRLIDQSAQVICIVLEMDGLLVNADGFLGIGISALVGRDEFRNVRHSNALSKHAPQLIEGFFSFTLIELDKRSVPFTLAR